jgi:hypothetical protein
VTTIQDSAMTEQTSRNVDFEQMDWHDATLLAVDIDRHAPGERDEVTLTVRWSDEREELVRFLDCYALDAQMNFGIVVSESIREARSTLDSERLLEIRQRWTMVGADLSGLRCYEISTSSTGSIIRIFALRFEVHGA